jgi:hypothetical protein
MDGIVDALVGVVERASESWIGTIALFSPIWLLAGVRGWQALRRRRSVQAFAAERRFRFLGTIASDARPPYTAFPQVSRSVLLTNVLEGESDGLPVRLFDLYPRRGTRWTAILVTVDDTVHRGPRAESVIAGRREAMVDTNFDVLFVSPKRLLDASELSAWLTFATTLAKAMEEDARSQRSEVR